MTAVVEPKPRADQKCVVCGKSKKRSRSAASGAGRAPVKTKAVRVNRAFWLTELERDAFCSRSCCEAFHGSTDHRASDEVVAA